MRSPFYRREERAKVVWESGNSEEAENKRRIKRGIREGTGGGPQESDGARVRYTRGRPRCWEEVFVSKIIVQGRVSGLDVPSCQARRLPSDSGQK